mmetsp:Transcript_107122/g.332868  ORF Transcript_107122/g.332868 Transcript_107122/m.332868 type:complete len:349 (+) Transcript_107122:133-1179(+)
MVDREHELTAEKELSALSKLQAAAGLVDKPQVERLDWMYEQSASQIKPDNDELMNKPVPEQKVKDIEDVKRLQESTAGSLFLRSATRTTEDALRKLREDPLFQVRRQEQAARESMMANPLIRARLQKRAEKQAKKQRKREKKAAKKERKAAKRARRRGACRSSGSSSSTSDSGTAASRGADEGAGPAGHQPLVRAAPGRPPSPRQGPHGQALGGRPDAGSAALGPGVGMVSKRREHAAALAERKEAALASRGAPRRMAEAEKRQRLEQMQLDAARHERHKDGRIAAAERREKEQEELEASMRRSSDQRYFREIRQEAYMDSTATMADRLKNQRHRRQKNINDPLERDG